MALGLFGPVAFGVLLFFAMIPKPTTVCEADCFMTRALQQWLAVTLEKQLRLMLTNSALKALLDLGIEGREFGLGGAGLRAAVESIQVQSLEFGFRG